MMRYFILCCLCAGDNFRIYFVDGHCWKKGDFLFHFHFKLLFVLKLLKEENYIFMGIIIGDVSHRIYIKTLC